MRAASLCLSLTWCAFAFASASAPAPGFCPPGLVATGSIDDGSQNANDIALTVLSDSVVPSCIVGGDEATNCRQTCYVVEQSGPPPGLFSVGFELPFCLVGQDIANFVNVTVDDVPVDVMVSSANFIVVSTADIASGGSLSICLTYDLIFDVDDISLAFLVQFSGSQMNIVDFADSCGPVDCTLPPSGTRSRPPCILRLTGQYATPPCHTSLLTTSR